MNKIVIGHHCFGDFIEVDDIDFNISEIDNEEERMKEIDIKKDEILNKISSFKDKLSDDDWKSLLYIITGLEQWDIDDESGYMHKCDQCGDWNDRVVFIKNNKI